MKRLDLVDADRTNSIYKFVDLSAIKKKTLLGVTYNGISF